MAQFKSRRVEKAYLALLHGTLEAERGIIDAPIGRDPDNRQRMAVLRDRGRPAQTRYDVREYIGDYSYVEATPMTGRTHQLRVHFAAVGHPIVGDRVYGRRRKPPLAPRQFLHAWRLTLEHPATGEKMTFTSGLAEDLATPLERLRADVALRT